MSFSKIQELRNKRAKLVKEAREILDRETEERSLTQEEVEQYERIMADVDKLGEQIEREERMAGLEGEFGGEKRAGGQEQPGEGGKEERVNPRATEEYCDAFRRWVVDGSAALSNDEHRSMQADSDVGGGYLVAPEQFVTDLLKNVDDTTVIRQLATIHQLESAKSLGVPTLEKDADDADWTAELKTGNTTGLKFGKRELRPHPLAKRALISNTLLRMSRLNPETLVRERIAYKFGITLEKAYMTGDGHQKPLGIFTPSNDGISTNRDVSEGNTATKISADALINVKYSLKGQYLARARWIFHRDVLKEIRKMKDGNGQYIWQPGITGGAPDRILEIPYTLSEYAPSTIASGKYVGVLGDFRYYWIVDALDLTIQRLVELYAETNQTGFIARYEGDGMPVLEEAFVRIKMGS